QLDLISFIWIMRDIGTPLNEIKDTAEHRTPDSLLTLFKEKKYLIERQIKKLNQISSMIDIQTEDIKEGKAADVHSISLIKCSDEPIFLGPIVDESKSDPFKSFFDYCSEHEFMYGHSMGEMIPWEGYNNIPRKRRFFYKTTEDMSNCKKTAGQYVTG